ncbi:MAG: peptide deformylase [Gammaproteobacteria bacterium]|jgi:peptide deformylase|nr:peptide deformylase [Gammaproteobacteria bacterium]
MAILQILHYPDPRLRNVATPVTVVDDEIRQLVDDMYETMYDAPGIGLAATQINVHKRILVTDVSEINNDPVCVINPRIVASAGSEQMEEGCLSVPGVFETVERAAQIRVQGLDRAGKAIEFDVDGLLAVCIQHEVDHLDGKLFVDYLSQLKRSRIRKKMEKDQKQSL